MCARLLLAGTWRLRIVDTGSSGGGTLNWWTLSLFTATSGGEWSCAQHSWRCCNARSRPFLHPACLSLQPCPVAAAFCSGNPSPITSNDASWPASCSGGGPTRPGAGCNAACSAGFIGPGYRATCTAGAWGSPFAIEQGCTRGCSGNPSISITNQAAWNCGSGTDAGSNCTAPCSAGYVGSATASCSATGTWSPPVGTCTPAREWHACLCCSASMHHRRLCNAFPLLSLLCMTPLLHPQPVVAP